ncbi:polysaccharide deacetylase [uncultured Anaerofustis sp.]|uniref:polysaccharide deacetylase n=1 Tax=uncultured Anaerofustis sp. TaxID=904996 RepID=UPI0025E7A460|nr:polysaccharide deacetylase [uncultured Anaerofustis sp.]
MNLEKLNQKKYIIAGIVLVSLFLVIKIILSPIIFASGSMDLEINSKLNAKDNIKITFFGSKDAVLIDDSEVDTNKIGTYTLIYKYRGKEYPIKVNVVDTVAPQFETVPLKIESGVKISPKSLVKNIKDATKTTIKFDKEYTFEDKGEYKVGVAVTDECGNETVKYTKIYVVKDETPPVISNIEPINVVESGALNLKKGVSVKDDYDPAPKLIINENNVDIKKAGSYKVIYKVTDRSGNIDLKERTVNVVKKIGTTKESKKKIVYLTFDDGPSANTKEILDILDKYNVKATFFVTGNGKKYNNLIKVAHDKGHTIALHTYTHNYKKVYKSEKAYFEDLNKLENMIKGIIGYSPKYIRFPGGSSNTVSRAYKKGIMSKLTKEVVNRGYQYYDWNCDSTDASGNEVAVGTLVKNATMCKEKNINILFHDTDAKDTTVKSLPKIIKKYKKRGYIFKAIDEKSYAPHHGVNN